jgi:sugar-specific transcriptional regulator TrmB
MTGRDVPRKGYTPMPETKAQRSAAGRKAAATRKQHAAEVEMPTAEKAVAKRTTEETATELSEQWLELVRTGGQTAIETLREFVETVEKVVPGPAKQREIIISGLEMAQEILRTQYDALRGLVRSAVLVNVNIDTDVTLDTDVGVEVPTNVDVASRESTT